MACKSAFLLHTQPGPELCRDCTPSHTCNPGRPPGSQPDFLSPLTARLLPRHPFLKSVPQAAHQPSSLFTILYSLNPPPAGSNSRSWLAGELSFCTRSRARKCAGAAHPRTPAIPEDRRAIMPNLLSSLTALLLPKPPPSKIRAAKRHTKPLHFSLFPIH